MTELEVIILAQGAQRRLGMQHGYKQLLPLPSCGGVPILLRTLRLLLGVPLHQRVTVVGWHEIWQAIYRPTPARSRAAFPWWVTLPNPGNSSLKGIARYLELSGIERGRGQAERTIVLLGDVVYSWACMSAIVSASSAVTGLGFVGTKDLSEGAGELWGVGWHHRCEDVMLAQLSDALLRHPPFEDEYQPGQLRRWIMGMERGELAKRLVTMRRTGNYTDIDDYTRDIDLPHHVTMLPGLSEQAADDDAAHGVTWGTWGA